MNTKKILSLIVAIAMIVAVVPSLGLVASAAEANGLSIEQWHTFAGEPVFVYPAGGGDLPLGDIYKGWSTSFTANNQETYADRGFTFDGNNFTSGLTNINNFWNCYQVYGASNTGDTVTMPGYGDGKDFIILEFMHSRGTSDFKHEYAVKDLTGKVIETGYVGRPDGFMAGKTSQFADVAPTPAYDGAATGMTNPVKVSTGYETGTRIVFVNNPDNTYSVIYYLANGSKGNGTDSQIGESAYHNTYQPSWESSKWEKMYTATYTGQFNGIGSIEYYVPSASAWSVNHRVNFLRIYEGDLPRTTVTVKYVDGDSVIETKKVEGQVVGTSFTPDASEYVVNEAKDTLYKLVEAPAAVTVAENMEIEVPYAKYRRIDGANVIENGSFEDGNTMGWLTGTGKDLLSNDTTFSIVTDPILATDGNNVLKAANSINNGGGTDGDHSIVTKWSVDTDSEYFLSVDAMQVRKSNNPYTWFATYDEGGKETRIASNIGNTERIQFSATKLEPYQLIVNTAGAVQIGYNASWFQDATIYYDNFQLYKLANLETQVKVKVEYTANGKTVYSDEDTYDTDLGEADVTFPEKYVYFEEEVYYLPKTTLSKSDAVPVEAYRYASKEIGETFEFDGAVYNVTGGSLVVNGDLKTGDAKPWTIRDGSSFPGSVVSTTVNGEAGNALNIYHVSGKSPTAHLGQVWSLEPATTYYISFDIANLQGSYASLTPTTNAEDARSAATTNISADADDLLKSDWAATTDWKKYEVIYTTPDEGTPYITLAFAWMDSAKLTNVEILPIKKDDTAKEIHIVVTAEDAEGTVLGTYETDGFEGVTTEVTVPAGVYKGVDGWWYIDSDVTVEIDDAKATITADKLTMFTYNYTKKEIVSSDGTYNAINAVSWNDRREGYALVTVPEDYDPDVYDLGLDATAWLNNGTGQAAVVNITKLAYEELMGLDITSAEFSGDKLEGTPVAEGVKTVELSGTYKSDDKAGDSRDTVHGTIKITGEYTPGEDVALRFISTSGIAVFSKVEMVLVPKVQLNVTPELGWNEGKFAIDFMFNGLEAAEGYTYGVDVTLWNGTPVASLTLDTDAEIDGVGFAVDSKYTNIPFIAKPWFSYNDKMAYSDDIYVSVYALLAEDIAEESYDDEAEFNTDKMAAAVDVFNKGGICVVGKEGSYDITDEMKQITTPAGDKTYTLSKSAQAVGLAFSVDMDTNNGKPGSDGSYDAYYTIKINENGTVTLTDGTDLAAALTVYLEEVQLVFVPEVVVETETQGDVSNAADFQDIL